VIIFAMLHDACQGAGLIEGMNSLTKSKGQTAAVEVGKVRQLPCLLERSDSHRVYWKGQTATVPIGKVRQLPCLLERSESKRVYWKGQGVDNR